MTKEGRLEMTKEERLEMTKEERLETTKERKARNDKQSVWRLQRNCVQNKELIFTRVLSDFVISSLR
jgi:hypothetical protein